MIDKNIECDIVSDLLPLYLEGKTGEESNLFVREHLDQCGLCRKNLEYMEMSYEDILKISYNKKKKHIKPFGKAKGTIFVCGYLLLLVLFWLYMIFFLFP